MDALAALGGEQRDHVVAALYKRDSLPHPLDDAGSLMTEDARRVTGRIGARGRVQVGVANAAGDEANQHLAGPRLRELDLLNNERLAERLEHGSANLHATTIKVGRAGLEPATACV